MPRRARSIPALSDGQRDYDLDILVENVASGWPTSARCRAAPRPSRTRSRRPRPSATRYAAVCGRSSTLEPELSPDDRQAIRARIRRLNDLGFAVDEIALEPAADRGDAVRLRVAVANRRFHARELERLTGLVALEGQARLLLNDLREYRSWLEFDRAARSTTSEAAERWLDEVLEPALTDAAAGHRPGCATRSRPTATCSRRSGSCPRLAGRDVGLEAAMDAYIGLGAPAPEARGRVDDVVALDIDWSTRLGARPPRPADRSDDAARAPATRLCTIGRHDSTSGRWCEPMRSIRVRGLIEALRRRPGRRRHRLRRRARRDLRAARARTAPARRRPSRSSRACARPTAARSACSASTSRRDADALKPRIGVSLQTAAMYPKLTVTELIDLFRSFYPKSRPTAELIEALELGERRNAQTQGPVRRAAPAAGRRPGPRQRPGARLPRRADDRPRSGGAPFAVGPRRGPQGARAGRSCSRPTTWRRPRSCATGSRSWTTARSSSWARSTSWSRSASRSAPSGSTPSDGLADGDLAALPAVSSVKHDDDADASLYTRDVGADDRCAAGRWPRHAGSSRRTWRSAGRRSRTCSST